MTRFLKKNGQVNGFAISNDTSSGFSEPKAV